MSLNLSCFYYHTGKCANYEFTCANGKCLSKWRRCRGGDDCGDGSDEQQCRKFVITVTVLQVVQSLMANYSSCAVVIRSRYEQILGAVSPPSLFFSESNN